ncbi:MAG: hypothetical protein MUC77_04245 [Chromatiaceae bacterium]|nr:hypothetical protein [Chromatiaceae bacterium]
MSRPRARIAHQTERRLRLRIDERRRDLVYFLGLYEYLRRLPGVEEVQADPLTGSALLHLQPGAVREVAIALAQSPWFMLDATPAAVRPVPPPTPEGP